MNKIVKAYQTNPNQQFLNVTIKIKLDSTRYTRVNFTGGRRIPFTPGTFVTDNPAFQKGIENHDTFKNGTIILSPGYEHLAGKYADESKTPAATTSSAAGPKNDSTPDNKTGPQKVMGITNAQGAKDWLCTNIPGVTINDCKNAVQTRETARIHNVEFPEWAERP